MSKVVLSHHIDSPKITRNNNQTQKNQTFNDTKTTITMTRVNEIFEWY